MILLKQFMGFQPGTKLEQVIVDKSPEGMTRVLGVHPEDTRIEFWCPSAILGNEDIAAADDGDVDPTDYAMNAARDLVRIKPKSIEEIADIIAASYDSVFDEYEKAISDERSLRRKWRSAWQILNARLSEQVKGQKQDAGGRLKDLLMLLKMHRTALEDMEVGV